MEAQNGSRDPDDAPFKVDLSTLCGDFTQPTCAQNFRTLASAVRDMVGAHQNLNGSRDLTIHLSGSG